MGSESNAIHDFTLVAAGLTDARQVPEDIAVKGCDDCSVWSREGVVRLIFHRQAATLNEAIGSAIVDLKNAGVSAWLESVGTPEDAVNVA